MQSEQADFTAEADRVPTAPVPLFDEADLKEFDRDDVEAGRNICKMLSLFFFYTVIVMGLSTLITYKWVTKAAGTSASAEAQPSEH
jgi:hypothetical protein